MKLYYAIKWWFFNRKIIQKICWSYFRSKNYPAYFYASTNTVTGEVINWIVIRNLDTHQYGGWLVPVEEAERMFGKKIITAILKEQKSTIGCNFRQE